MANREVSNHNFTKVLLAVVAVILLIGAGVGVALLVTSKNKTNKPVEAQVSNQSNNSSTTSSSQYKLAACKSGTAQTIANANYAVGGDIAPGSYKVVSQPAGIGWTNIDVYNNQSDYQKAQNPNSAVTDNSFQATNSDDSAETPAPTYTKLNDGQYMVIGADPAIFTCE
jgi:hypothetical protein